MMYIIVILVLVLVVVYVTWRWLSAEARDALAGLRVALRVRRGGRTPELLIREARRACHDEGLDPDFIIVAHTALDLYERLRRHVIGRSDRPDLPAATVLALAADVDAGRLYLRSVATPTGAPGRETVTFHDFAAIEGISVVPHEGPNQAVAPAREAIALHLADAAPREHRLAVEPGWHLAADDLARRLEQVLRDRRRPAGAPVIVR